MADISPGTDISTFPDLDPTFAIIDGYKALGQALARRYETPAGGLFYDPTYGYDLRALLLQSVRPGDLAAIQRAIEEQALLDERVLSAIARAVFFADFQADGLLTVTLRLTTAAGPYTLTLQVSDMTVTLLHPNLNA